jgi:magnesium chelatase subunit I
MQFDIESVKTLADLRKTNWKSVSVKEEMRANLIKKLQAKEPLFPGIVGYEKTVIPQIQNAILSKHDIILLGLRGQGKTRILRSLVDFLDPFIPIVEGSEIHDDPYKPLSRYARDIIAKYDGETRISWIPRNQRYAEKLATPDTTVADLIGDIDPIKAATQKLALSDEQVINFGLIPRTHRGIFAINELPDLQPRIQVSLLNIMQERDIQIRGFNVRIPVDVCMVFSANPEDYTNRGNIITPLKDRIDSQIITHYPKSIDQGIEITSQEAKTERDNNIEIAIPALCPRDYRTNRL